MHPRSIAYLLSALLAICAAAMLVPLGVALLYGERHSALALLGAATLTGGLAGGCRLVARGAPTNVKRREAVATVALG